MIFRPTPLAGAMIVDPEPIEDARGFFARVPVHHFALLRLPVIYRRLGDQPELRSHFVHELPRLVVAEWTLGASAVRYAVSPPPAAGHSGGGFR